jgi:hypothetical protein
MAELEEDGIPNIVEVALSYAFIFQKDKKGNNILDEFNRPIRKVYVYAFSVLRDAEAKLNERERVLGNGQKLSPAERLAGLLVKEPEGWEAFPRDGRPLADRVCAFFGQTIKRQQFAQDALDARIAVIYPSQVFLPPANNKLEVGGDGTEPDGDRIPAGQAV